MTIDEAIYGAENPITMSYSKAEAALLVLAAEVRRLRAAVEAGDGWVSVEERLPEEGSKILALAYHPARKLAAFYVAAYFVHGQFTHDGGSSYGGITHWRPLPPLPVAEVEG